MKNYKYENQQLELTKVSLICLNMNYIQFFQITYFESLIFLFGPSFQNHSMQNI